jgi:hypothetical protein
MWLYHSLSLAIAAVALARVTAHHAAHGKDNGANTGAVKFKGFQTDLDMVPLVCIPKTLSVLIL